MVSGNNSVIDPKTGQVLVPGFTAAPGFDVASGWGTVDASMFVPALVARHRGCPAWPVRPGMRPRRELSRLEHSIRLSAPNIGPGGTSTVTDGGFLPGHPVKLAIDGTVVTTLTAELTGHGQLHAQPVRAGPGRRAPCADAAGHADHHHGDFHEPVS